MLRGEEAREDREGGEGWGREERGRGAEREAEIRWW